MMISCNTILLPHECGDANDGTPAFRDAQWLDEVALSLFFWKWYHDL